MIPVVMIVAAVAVGVGAGIARVFWTELTDFLKEAIEKVKDILSGVLNGVLYGVKALLKRVGQKIQQIARHYSKVQDHWEETTVTRTISENEVPEDILRRVRSDTELDISDELEMQLSA